MENRFVTILLVVTLLFSALTMRQCRENKELVSQVEDLASYKSEAKYYKDKNGEVIAYNKSLETSVEALNIQRAELMQQVKDMRIKKPQVITTTVSQTLIDSIVIPFETKLPCDSPFVQPFSYNDVWVHIDGSVDNVSLRIDNIFIQDSLLIVVGEKRNGLFKRNEVIVAVKHSNPHVTTTDIENFMIKPRGKFWQRGWFYGVVFGTGVVVGMLIK